MLLLLSLLSTAVVPHSVKLPNFKNLYPKTTLPLALKDSDKGIKQERISHGRSANSSIAPFQILLMMHYGYCGGCILDESWVITAAHCLTNDFARFHPSDFKILAGELDRTRIEDSEQLRRVDMVIVHHSYDSATTSHDLGLLHLESPFIFNDIVSSIALAEEMPLPGDRVRTSGYGINHNYEEPIKLKWIEQDVPSIEDCAQAYRDLHPDIVVDDTMLCTGNANGGIPDMWYRAGLGDSGGPIHQIINGTSYLVGLVSWGSDICYDVSTRITAFTDWIENNMESEYETLVVENNDKQWSWSSGLNAYNSKYVKLGCNTDSCRVHIKTLKIEFSGGHADLNFRMTLFEGWGLSEGDDAKDPMVTIDVINYAPIPADAGYVAEGNKMTVVILLGGREAEYVVKFTYAVFDDSLCKDEAKKCNQINDCMDLSDEIGCEYSDTDKGDMSESAAGCYQGDFKCAEDGYCIRKYKKCNQVNDCEDRSDEIGCAYSETKKAGMRDFAAGCYRSDFKCGKDSYCVRKYKKCDGQQDCPEGDDETDNACGAAFYISVPVHVILSVCILSLIFGQ